MADLPAEPAVCHNPCCNDDAQGSLGKLGSLLQPQVTTARALRYKRRNRAHRWDKVDPDTGKYKNTHWCGEPLRADVVELVETEGGGVMPSQVQFCKAVWACPVCSSIIRSARGKEIAQAVDNWQAAGNSVFLVTVTIRHSAKDDLGFLLDVMSDAWRRTVSGAVWKRYKASWGLVGYTRTLEITYSLQNGWHPHFHFLYFVDGDADALLAARMQKEIYDRFTACLAKAGAKAANMPNIAHGVDVRHVDAGGKVLGTYVSKVCNIAAEVSASQTKSGRLPDNLDPFQLLDINQPWARNAWGDYLEGTKGKRSIYFSRGLRELVGIEKEKDDAAVVDEAIEGEHNVVGAITVGMYRRIHAREQFDEYDKALRLAETSKWKDAAAVLSSTLSTYVDAKTGEVLPLLC